MAACVAFGACDPAAAAAIATLMPSNLSTKVTLAPRTVLDQPSGTSKLYPPGAELYVTKACVSGMSPGGFDSAASGRSVDVDMAAAVDAAVAAAVVTGAELWSLFWLVQPTSTQVSNRRNIFI